jgi:hypothetical protein
MTTTKQIEAVLPQRFCAVGFSMRARAFATEGDS